jgi:hypothetical protein
MVDYSKPHAYVRVDGHRFYRAAHTPWYWGHSDPTPATPEQLEMINRELIEKTGKPRFTPTYLRT